MKKYNFDESIERRNTDSLKYDFAKKRGMPEDVLPLWVADMDFQVAPVILQKLQERVNHGIFGYSEPGDSYVEAVANWMERRHQFFVDKKWLVKTPGVVFGLAMAVKAYTKEGEGVIIQPPVYYPFRQVIEDNDRMVIENPLVQKEDGLFYMNLEDFEAKVIKHQVKLFFFCSPHNPVSRVWSKAELIQLADICIRHKVIVISDEIHQDFVYGTNKHTVFATLNDQIKDQVIIATAPSKTFNLAGLQVANFFIPNKILRAQLKKVMNATGYSQLNTLGLVACEIAYREGEDWLDELIGYLEENIALVGTFLEKELPKIKLINPQGTYLIWLDFTETGYTDQEINRRIIHESKLWLDGGSMFGKEGALFQRINITCPKSVLIQALEQLKIGFCEANN